MKIRMRTNHHDVREVVELKGAYDYAWCDINVRGVKTLYSPEYWEPVPTQTWRDVTAECEMNERGELIREHPCDPLAGGRVFVRVADGYRLHKVEISPKTLRGEIDAFLVEHLE